MEPILGETIYIDFVTSAATGAAVDADGTPTFEVFENDTDTALTITGGSLAKRTNKTGNYRITLPLNSADGFEEDKTYNVIASASVGGVACKAVVGIFQIRAPKTTLQQIEASTVLAKEASIQALNDISATDVLLAAEQAIDAKLPIGVTKIAGAGTTITTLDALATEATSQSILSNIVDIHNDLSNITPSNISMVDVQAAAEAAIDAKLPAGSTNIAGAGVSVTNLDQITGSTGSGTGAIAWEYTLTDSISGSPIADAKVWVTTDMAGNNIIASGRTNQYGTVVFYLDAGTVYVWSQKSGWNFDNPDIEVVS